MKQKSGFFLLSIYAVYDLLFLVTDQSFPLIKEDYTKLTVSDLVLTAAGKNIALAPFLGKAVICHSNLLKHTWYMSNNFALTAISLISKKSLLFLEWDTPGQAGSSGFTRTALSENSRTRAAKPPVFKLLLHISSDSSATASSKRPKNWLHMATFRSWAFTRQFHFEKYWKQVTCWQIYHQEELQRDEVDTTYTVALKANILAWQVGYLTIACLSVVLKESQQIIQKPSFNKAQSLNNLEFQIKFSVWFSGIFYSCWNIPLPALKWRYFEFLSWSRHSETRHRDLVYTIYKGTSLPASNVLLYCPFLQPTEL